jgi:hypothetical protein
MSVKKAGCPQCGAPVEFRFSSAVQTTCEFCKSILVRHDVDLEKVGQVADLPDSSPIQLMTEGIYGGKAFWVAGRIAYQWDQGGWNEWHIVFQDGASGWLSDAQAQYAVTFERKPEAPLPAQDQVHPGLRCRFGGLDYEVTTLTLAQYVGVQGELPFEYWDKYKLLFVVFLTKEGKFGTIDYSEEPAMLFTGEAVEFDALQLKNLREFEGW